MLQEAGLLVLQENHCDIGHPIAASSTASLFEVIHQQHKFDKIKLMLMRRREEEYQNERARMIKRHTAFKFPGCTYLQSKTFFCKKKLGRVSS
jgi:hypothetical protein